MPKPDRLLPVPTVAIAGLLLTTFWLVFTAHARANDLSTLDAHAETPGNVIEDAAGDAYIGWVHEVNGGGPNLPMFCKVPAGGTCTAPQTLPIPLAKEDTEDVNGLFPVFGAGATVYLVAPRYGENDVIIWTSTNGGASFNAGTINEGGYSDKTDPSSVLLRGSELLIGANNPGLGFSATPAGGGAGTNLDFASPGSSVASSSLALDSASNPVEAYWNDGSTYEVLFYRYKGSGSLTSEANWVGPTAVAAGDEPKLSGGAAGLFLVSQDYAPGGPYPTLLDLRRYEGTTFGAPVTLADDTSEELFDSGAIAESPDGRLAVAWPGFRGSERVMRLFSSTNGGAGFTETEVAHLGSSYEDQNNAQLAVGDAGNGWLTYLNAAGLQLADLNPIAPLPGPPPPPPPPAPAPIVTVPKAKKKSYSGPTKTSSTAVGGNLLTLTVPKVCVAPSQPFYIGVGRKARHKVAKLLRAKLKVVTVIFSFDGKKLKKLKKKPFRYLVPTSALAVGGKHVIAAKVTAIIKRNGKFKKVVRILKGEITIC